MATLPSPVEVNLPGRILARSGLDSQIPGAALRLGEIAFTTDSARFWVGDDSQSPPWIITNKFKGSVDWTGLNPTFNNINVSTINGQTIAQVIAANTSSSNSGSNSGSNSSGSTGSSGSSGSSLSANDAVPMGTIIMLAGGSIPSGYLTADGRTISRTTYASLWSFAQSSANLVSESSWGTATTGSFSTGDGSTTFRIPNLRGTFVRALSLGNGLDAGRGIGTYQENQVINHYHPTTHGATYFITVYAAAGPAYVAYDYSTGTFGYDNLTPNGGGSETRPVNVALPFLIRAY